MRTNCSNCCFLSQDENGFGCSAGRYCVIGSDNVHTPGFCRLKRTQKWKQGHPDTLDNNSLITIAQKETELSFDLLIIFDECLHEKEDLQKTIETDWMQDKCNQIIICDISGKRVNNYNSVNYFENYDGFIPLKLDVSINAENPVRSVRRNAKITRSNYFLVLPAGKILSNIESLSKQIDCDTRSIMWMFQQKCGQTLLNFKGNTIFSLYLKQAFDLISSHCVEECLSDQVCECKPFFNDVKKLEKETSAKIFLVQMINDCVIK